MIITKKKEIGMSMMTKGVMIMTKMKKIATTDIKSPGMMRTENTLKIIIRTNLIMQVEPTKNMHMTKQVRMRETMITILIS